MSEHPIEGLMTTAMSSIQDMIDVNTIIGEPIETSNNIVIIPISKVSFGFAAGGSEFKGETVDEYKKKEKEEEVQYRLPFGGGSGAGVTINPIAFLVIQGENVKLMPVNYSSSIDKLLDYIPDFLDKTNKAGINIPIIPGVMPILSYKQIDKITRLCGASIDESLKNYLLQHENDPDSMAKAGLEFSQKQCQQLADAEVRGIHLYSLNKFKHMVTLLENLL